jgi:hypothetical protein
MTSDRWRLSSVNFATKAIVAGLAERTVRVAERQGHLMVEMVQSALREVDLYPQRASGFKTALARGAGAARARFLIRKTAMRFTIPSRKLTRPTAVPITVKRTTKGPGQRR